MAVFDSKPIPLTSTQWGIKAVQLSIKLLLPTLCSPSWYAYMCERVWWRALQAAAHQHQAFLMSP